MSVYCKEPLGTLRSIPNRVSAQQRARWYSRFVRTRYQRYALLKTLTQLFPSLQDHWHYYPKTVATETIATHVEHHPYVHHCSNRFTPEQLHYAESCHDPLIQPWTISRKLYRLERSMLITGHTGVSLCAKTHRVIGSNDHNQAYRNKKAVIIQGPETITYNALGVQKGHDHFFHFITDYLQHLWYYLHHHHDSEKPLTVLVRPNLSEQQKHFFRALASQYPCINFFTVERNHVIESSNLVHVEQDHMHRPTTVFLDPKYIEFLRAAFSQPKKAPCRKIYLTRKDAKRRLLLNESEILKYMEQLNFEMICPTDLSYQKQVTLFQEAKQIVTTHGAALTNVLFCQPNAHIFEITPLNYRKVEYLWHTRSIGASHSTIIGSQTDHRQNFTCDIELLKKALKMNG